MNLDLGIRVFINCFLSNISFGLEKDFLYKISLQFNHNVLYFSFFYFAAFFLAINFNYFIGRLFRQYSRNYQETSFTSFLQKFSPLILFAIFPINGLFSQIFGIIYGFLNEKLYKYLLFATIGKAFYVLLLK